MALTGKQRLKAFIVGAGVGGVLAGMLVWHHGWPKPRSVPEPGVVRRQVPGVLAQWTGSGQPIEGSFVLSQMLEPRAADGTRLRAVVVPGLDDDSFIRVEEIWAAGNPTRVKAWKFMFADRILVKLKEGADTGTFTTALRAHGWTLVRRDPASGWITIGLNAHDAKTVAAARAELSTWPQVAEAAPDELPGPGTDGQ